MTEYWLQKKTIGGWSHVTWYATEQEAMAQYNKLGNDTGYSWRVCKVEPVAEKLLYDHEEPKPPEVWASSPAPIVKNSGWGDQASDWPEKRTSDNPIMNTGWSSTPAVHGMTGKVWMVNHAKRLRARVDANSVALYEADGYERGGPKTAFREG